MSVTEKELHNNLLQTNASYINKQKISNVTNLRLVPIEKPRISIFGLGYVGAVSAACFCDLGHEVVGVDPDIKKVDSINKGNAPIVEKGLNVLLSKANQDSLLSATTEAITAVIETDITFVSVGTPSSEDGSCDLTYLKEAAAQIGKALSLKESFHLVMFRSTVPPTTTRSVMLPIIEQYSGKKCGEAFGICFNPEFLRESTAIDDFYAPPKTVLGAFDDKSAKIAEGLYKDKVSGEIIHTSIESAEFVKYIDNTWHALKVVFGNEVGRICKAMGVDSHEVMNIFCKDTKLNLSPYYLMPGYAYGGSCLPKDTRGIKHLAKLYGVDVPVIDNIGKSNDKHIRHAEEMIDMLPGNRIGFLGVTFKSGTDDLRESPTVELIQRLERKGYDIRIYDPNFVPEPLHDTDHSQQKSNSIGQKLSQYNCSSAYQMMDSCNMLVVSHNNDEFKSIVKRAANLLPIVDLVRLFENKPQNSKIEGICW